MHQAVLNWVSQSLLEWGPDANNLTVSEFGSLDINGSVRSVLEPRSSSYIGIDQQTGRGVDIVGDASTYIDTDLIEKVDVIVCCEVFEHTPKWREIVGNSYRHLRNGGLFIATMAGEGRHPHSALDENPIREWEYYANVGAWELGRAMRIFSTYKVDVLGTDIRTMGVK